MINKITPSHLDGKNESELYKVCSCLGCDNIGQNILKVSHVRKMISVCDECKSELIKMGLVESEDKEKLCDRKNGN